MSKLEKYSNFKNSRVHTSIDIPKHWKIKRFKHIFSFGKGLAITKENLGDRGIECVNYGEIHSKYGFELNPEIHTLKCVNESYLKNGSKSLLNFGDFVFADTSEDIEGSGNFTHLNSSKNIFAGYHTVICKPRKIINSRYFAYLLDSQSFRSQIQKRVKGVKVYSITQNILKDTFVWIPEDDEQIKIVSFLDTKTKKLNKAIKQKEQLIELLTEQRQILINNAVAKGIDKTVTMKDSGVEWIGNIPKHWEVKKLKYILTEINIRSTVGNEELLSLSKYKGVIPKSSLKERAGMAQSLIGYKKVFKNTLVINKMQAVNGLLSVSKLEGITSPDYSIYKVINDNLNIDYYGYLLNQAVYLSEFKKVVTGVMEGFIRLYTDDLYNIYTYVPSKQEQEIIVSYIEDNNNKIDKAIDLQQKQITKLKEYKTTLIDSIVTGKRRV